MPHSLRHIILLSTLMIVCGFKKLQGQTFPIDVIVNSSPGAAPYLDGHINSVFENMNIDLILRDVNEVSLPVQLRIVIQGPNIEIRNNVGFTSAAIVLEPNIPYRVSSNELSSIYQAQNISVFGALSQTEWENNGRLLPSGSYLVCVEVLDFFRPDEAPLSRLACNSFFLELMPPPIITLPAVSPGEEFALIPMQQTVFNLVWQHAPVNCPGVQYTLRMYEDLSGEGLSAQLQIDNGIGLLLPVLTELPLSPFLIDPSTFNIDRSKDYFVQIQANHPFEACEFVRSGYSEIRKIRFGSKGDIGNCEDLQSPKIIDIKSLDDYENDYVKPGFSIRWKKVENPEAVNYVVMTSTEEDFDFQMDPNEPDPRLLDLVEDVGNFSKAIIEGLPTDGTNKFYIKVFAEFEGNYTQCRTFDKGIFELPTRSNEDLDSLGCESLQAAVWVGEAEVLSSTSFTVQWESNPEIEQNVIELSKDENFLNSVFDSVEAAINTYTFDDLDEDSKYFFRLISRYKTPNDTCFRYSQAREVHLNSSTRCRLLVVETDTNLTCDIDFASMDFEEDPFPTLYENDTILAADFLITVDEVAGSSPFSGKGHALIAFDELELFPEGTFEDLGSGNGIFAEDAGFYVNFDLIDVEINSDCRMINGRMHLTGAGVNVLDEELTDVLEDVLDVTNTAEDVLDVFDFIVELVDSILAETEEYLPDSVITNLEDAQDQLIDAKDHLDSIKQLCSEMTPEMRDSMNCDSLIEAAKDSLMAAKDSLKVAISEYIASVKEFYVQVLEVVRGIVSSLMECNVQALENSMSMSRVNWRDLNRNHNEALLENSGLGIEVPLEEIGDVDELDLQYDFYIEEKSDSSGGDYGSKAKNYYTIEKEFMVCSAINSIMSELSESSLPELLNLLKLAGEDIKEPIGTAIAEGKDVDTIVEEVTPLFVKSLTQGIDRAYYPAISFSDE